MAVRLVRSRSPSCGRFATQTLPKVTIPTCCRPIGASTTIDTSGIRPQRTDRRDGEPIAEPLGDVASVEHEASDKVSPNSVR